MKGSNSIWLSLIAFVGVLIIAACIGDGKSSKSNNNKSTSGYSTSENSIEKSNNGGSNNGSTNGGYTNGGGYRSSYWYDSPSTAKKKADDTLKKYYDVDKDGHILGPKEGTIRNGKPYHKTK